MKHLHLLTLVTVFACLIALAAGPATQPTTQPASAKIDQLIKQLGDDDFATREKATEQLKSIGKEALPALKEAQKSDDPETRVRAQSIVDQLEGRAKPAAARGGVQPEIIAPMIVGPGGGMIQIMPGQMQVQVQMNGNGNREMESVANGRKVHISENPNGIKMTITEPDKDGKEETKEYAAKNAEELKKDHPDVYPEYEKLAQGPNNVAIAIGQAQIMPGVMPGMVAPQPAGGFDDRLRATMRRTAERLAKPTSIGASMTPVEEELQSQLGDGLVVRKVNPDSRAEKIGLQRMDLITKVNEKRVKTIADLEEAGKGDGKLTIEGFRAGKPLKLEEK